MAEKLVALNEDLAEINSLLETVRRDNSKHMLVREKVRLTEEIKEVNLKVVEESAI